MVSRRYLRIKVMQAIYAHDMNDKETIPMGERKLDVAISACYTLFLYFFSILPEIKRYRLNKFEDLKSKINPTFEDLHPNTNFVENRVIEQIESNNTLNKLWKENKVTWTGEGDFIVQMYREIQSLPEYDTYMEISHCNYQNDKELILAVIEKVFVESELLHWYFEEKNVHWFDDYNEAMMMFYKNVETFKENKKNDCKIASLFKEDDEAFFHTLFRKTIMNNDEYKVIIDNKLHNWESERVMGIDMILMKMAICEFLEFPSIPIKVTINEYLELAKTYSSPKSSLFINGMLDKIFIDFREKGQLNKIGRGLLENNLHNV